MPFWLYLYGSVVAMIASFLVIGYFSDKKSVDFAYKKTDLSGFKFFKFLTRDGFIKTVKTLSVILFSLTIVTGLFGQNSAYSNFNMTFFWIIFVLGLTYMSAIFGNIYSVLNPLKILTDWLSKENGKPWAVYPTSFGYYPALLFYFIFIWIELVWQNSPLSLSVILIIYTLITDFGVILWGSEIWYTYCEFFSVFFRLISKIAPFEYDSGKIYLRAPFVGLLTEKAENISLLLFTLFMLSSTAFDGFKETSAWTKVYFGHIDSFVRPVLGIYSYPVFETLGLFLSPFIFLAIYVFLIFWAKKIAKSEISLRDLLLEFAFSLIPIVLVYNIAHYFTLIFSEGPNIIRLISDPFGFNLNVFGTKTLGQGIILGANFVWHAEVVFILLGHIVSVYLTHIVALKVFENEKRAFWSQLPMLVLMILYTLIGLWILSQPITAGF